jgi:hypothetical protein
MGARFGLLSSPLAPCCAASPGPAYRIGGTNGIDHHFGLNFKRLVMDRFAFSGRTRRGLVEHIAGNLPESNIGERCWQAHFRCKLQNIIY